MVCMNKLFNQQYFKYLYKSNRRLLILIWAILFICICFFTTIFTINDFTAYSEVQAFVTAMSGFCGISISMFVPIYFFRFLYRKRSCDLYYGLPIRKKELFSTTFLFGYLAILIPIAVYFLSTSIIASQFMNVLSSTILMNIKVMGFFAIFMLCIQAIICFLCIRCNTMMDALFISGTYVILPFILYISMNIFLKEQVNVEYMFVDNAAMKLIQQPKHFDVIVTENMFGDILTDEASVITGSLGLLPSASIGIHTSLFEPIHGSYPQAAGKNVANPLATILSAAMMFEYAFNLKAAGASIRQAVDRSVEAGIVTEDIAEDGQAYPTSEVGDFIAKNIG